MAYPKVVTGVRIDKHVAVDPTESYYSGGESERKEIVEYIP